MVGLNAEQIVASRQGRAASEKVTAALTFAKRILDTKGQVVEQDIAVVREVGYSDGEIAEIIAHVALNVFTNYFNIATDVDNDFPKVSYQEIA
jgi:alkylhydroperoxidase family enzyme